MGVLNRTGWTVTADSVLASPTYDAVNVKDADEDTIFHSDTGYPHYLQVDLGSAQVFDTLEFHPRQPAGSIRCPLTWKIEVSSNGSSWTQILTGSWVDDRAARWEVFTQQNIRYFKFTGLTGNDDYMACSELYLWTHDGEQFAPHDMTTDSSHSPFVASASLNSTDAFKVFDGSITDYLFGTWNGTTFSNPSEIKIDVGTSALLKEYAISINNPYATRAPKTWTVQGSNDNSSWTTIDTVVSETNWTSAGVYSGFVGTERRSFVVDTQTTYYRYFKWVITANNTHADVNIGEIFLYGLTSSPDVTESVSDSISLSDALETVLLNIWQSPSDSVSLSDFSDNPGFNFIEALNIQDELDVLVISQAKKVWAILVGDNLSFNDDLGRFATYGTLLGDSYSITDRTAALNEKFLTLVDSVSLLDAIGNIDSFFDGFSLLDAASYSLDAVPITDYTFLLTDSILIGDDGSTFISAPEFLSVADILLLTDRAAVRVQANLTDYLRRYLNDVPTPLT